MYIEFRDVSGKMVQLPLTEDEPITIGRNPGSSIYSKESTVSRNHGRIGHDGSGWYIKDLGSSNGTFINNDRTTRAEVGVGDVVRCGEVLEIHFKDGSPTSAPASRGKRQRRNQPTTMGRDVPKAAAASSSRSRADERARRRAEKEAERERKRRARDQRRSQQNPQVSEKDARAAREKPPREKPPREKPPREKPPREKPPREKPPREKPRAEIHRPPIRKGMDTGQSRVVVAVDDGPAKAGELAELRRKVAALEASAADVASRAEQAENQARSAETRASRYSVELDGLHDKYVKLKEQNKVLSRSLEDVRGELSDREDEALEATREVTKLEAQITKAREKEADATEQLSGYKIRLTQKDRQIEELQRQLDLNEYELRETRDQMENLEEQFNREGGDSNRLERKINLLQEVIEEKEAVIEQLRIDLRDKDIEIRQVRMGVGISDLEHEKRTLLEDYHNSMRRIDEMQQEISKKQREADDLRGQIETERRAAEERKSAGPADITEHPDYKAKEREVARLEEKIEDLQREVARLEVKLESAGDSSDEVARLEGENKALEMKTDSLQSKLEAATERIEELQDLEPEEEVAAPAFTEEQMEDVQSLIDAAAASKANARLVRKYAQNIEKAAEGELAEDAELLYDTAIVLVQDLGEQERTVRELFGSLKGDDE